MLEVKISIIGKTTEDLVSAIDQVKAKIEEGYANDYKGLDGDKGAWHFSLFDGEDRCKSQQSNYDKLFVIHACTKIGPGLDCCASEICKACEDPPERLLKAVK